ncbi:MAG: phosphoribosyltransferase [Desulfosudaceae bacterium]
MTVVHDQQQLRNQRWVFAHREEAGRRLSRMLEPVYGGTKDTILLAIPMGGVPVAAAMAESLGCPLEAIIVRKIQVPGNTEAGFGAMTPQGEVFLNQALVNRLGLTEEQIQRQADQVRRELAERDRSLRGGRPFPELAGRTVILVDDGLASGFTMKAAVHLARRREVARIVVAVPTAPWRTVDDLAGQVEEIYCLNIREGLSFAVAEAYQHWYDLSEAEARQLLSRSVQTPG